MPRAEQDALLPAIPDARLFVYSDAPTGWLFTEVSLKVVVGGDARALDGRRR